ncbi:MAG: hypothetical protein HYU75_07610 [Betaproteobacteria bacterium]|nr:hypothetical protein [Betaproteobacteria bacterium]
MFRNIEHTLLGDGHDARTLYVVSEAARDLEKAADDLMHTALMLREHVLRQVRVS